MKLILTRHGETQWNAEGRWQGQTNTELSKVGKKQAKKLAERLKSEKIEVIYSSPLNRALDTAKEIHKFHPKAKLVIDDNLKEVNFGVFEGHTDQESWEKHKAIHEERNKDKFTYKGHGGESLGEAEQRGLEALNNIIANKKDCLIVAHGALNKLLLKHLTKMSYEEISKHHYNHTSVTEFEIEGKTVKTKEFNCIKHLN